MKSAPPRLSIDVRLTTDTKRCPEGRGGAAVNVRVDGLFLRGRKKTSAISHRRQYDDGIEHSQIM